MRAKEIAQKLLRDLPDVLEHSERVKNLCKPFRDEFNSEIDWYLLKRAAWLHDVGKSVSAEDHHKKKVIRKALEGYELKSDKDDVISVISCHKGKFKPESWLELESAILRICDKLDRFRKGKADAAEKCEKSMEQIKNVLDESTWKRFQKVYQKVYEDVRKELDESST